MYIYSIYVYDPCSVSHTSFDPPPRTLPSTCLGDAAQEAAKRAEYFAQHLTPVAVLLNPGTAEPESQEPSHPTSGPSERRADGQVRALQGVHRA